MGKGGLTTTELLRAYHERGDAAARQQLVELYLPLVESFTRRHARGSEDYDDLYQVGCIGLINAIDRFEVSRGDELAAFAVPNIAGEIRRYQRDRSGSVRLPRRVMELRSPAVAAQAELRAKLGREPTAAEIAADLAAAEGDVALALDAAASQAVELQPEDAGAEDMGAAEDRLFLSDAVRSLDERERRVVYLRFVRDAEPDAIATELGISRRQLARITDEALRKLRTELETPGGTTPPKPRSAAPREPKIPVTAPPARSERQIEQQYHIELVKSDEAGGWTAQVDELSGCVAHGATPQEAAAGVEAAIRDWIATAQAEGREIPKPRSASSYSGRLLVRMPQSLHAELARAAEHEEISLNQFITSSLASAVHWRGSAAAESTGADADGGGSRNMSRALLANLLLLAVIAALALVLLVVAVSRS